MRATIYILIQFSIFGSIGINNEESSFFFFAVRADCLPSGPCLVLDFMNMVTQKSPYPSLIKGEIFSSLRQMEAGRDLTAGFIRCRIYEAVYLGPCGNRPASGKGGHGRNFSGAVDPIPRPPK
jgi:hypothetical protein